MSKMGWFGIVRGHSRSLEIAPLYRAHTSSIVTTAPFLRHVGRKSPIWTYLTSIWRPRWGDPVGISP